jgi:hypothetical protein
MNGMAKLSERPNERATTQRLQSILKGAFSGPPHSTQGYSQRERRVPPNRQKENEETAGQAVAMDYKLEPESGSFKLTGGNVSLMHIVTVVAVKRNWWLLSIYGLVTIAGIYASYFMSGWSSVIVSSAVAAITFVVGLRMWQQVITITKEIR